MQHSASALHPALVTDTGTPDFGVLRWLREQVRYVRAMRELNGIERATLDDIGISPDQFPALARRHARGLAPLERAQAN